MPVGSPAVLGALASLREKRCRVVSWAFEIKRLSIKEEHHGENHRH